MTRKKSLIIALALVVVTVTVVLVLRFYIFSQIEVKVKEAFQRLNEKGLTIKYDSLSVSWSKNEIHVLGLSIAKSKYDTTCVPSGLKTKGVHIRGLNLLKLVALQKFSIDEIHIDSLDLKIIRGVKLFQDSSASKNPFFIKTASVIFSGAKVQFIDTLCQVESTVESSFKLSDINIEAQPDKPFIATVSAITMTHNKAVLPKSNYTLTIAEIRANLLKGIMAIDTIRIIPHLSELAFGRNAGHDVDRIDGSIPFLNFSGIEYQFMDTLAFRARKVDVQFFLKLFHDKRLPHKDIYKPLPLEQLQSLGFGLIIDTLEIKKSYVAYEEFAEDAEEPGLVYFDNIAGHFHNVNNDGTLQEGETTMEARANFMGDGLLNIRTIFPYKSTENCHLEGSLKNFSFEKVNPMLSPSTNLRFESGQINSLTFAFDYNNTRSDGSIDLNYEGLKLVSLKEDKKVTKAERRRRKKQNIREDLKKDNLKTFIINTFVLKKNMDERLPAEKRTGTVLFYRDTTRSTFNYWWKSLSSGLKSAFHLDKPAAK